MNLLSISRTSFYFVCLLFSFKLSSFPIGIETYANGETMYSNDGGNVTAQALNNKTIPHFSNQPGTLSYIIVSNGSVSNIKPYQDALNNANWNCYRLLNKRRKLMFDTGVIVELLSVKELREKGNKTDTSCITDEKNLSLNQPVYHLSESGFIIELHPDATNSKDKSTNTK